VDPFKLSVSVLADHSKHYVTNRFLRCGKCSGLLLSASGFVPEGLSTRWSFWVQGTSLVRNMHTPLFTVKILQSCAKPSLELRPAYGSLLVRLCLPLGPWRGMGQGHSTFPTYVGTHTFHLGSSLISGEACRRLGLQVAAGSGRRQSSWSRTQTGGGEDFVEIA
jgi:hypothetical protein